MSNFLQRVAATVIQPRARLHPMVGSIFAPSTLSLPAEFSSTQTEISSQAFAPHRHEPTHFDGSSHAFASRPFSNEDRLFPATLPEDSSSARSNLSPSADQPLLPVFNSVGGRTEPHSSAEDAGPIFESSEVAAANHSVSPDPDQPLIAAGRQPPPGLQPRESPPTAAVARTFASEAARRTQPAQREADEIHIHIGRIEVAAIIQPSPRPAAAAARRSLNLDEYLKRGNGRPG
jgi:hypothetical protein